MTEFEYGAAMAALHALMRVDPAPKSTLGKCLLMLALECEEYELKHHSHQNPYRNAPE